MRGGELVFLGLCAAFAALLAASPLTLPYWQGRVPGAAFLPFWIGLAILAMVALIGMSRLRAGVVSGDGDPAPARLLLKPWIVFGALLLAIGGLEVVGFLAASTLFLAFVWWAVERRSALVSVASGFATALAATLLFRTMLGADLPAGLWGF